MEPLVKLIQELAKLTFGPHMIVPLLYAVLGVAGYIARHMVTQKDIDNSITAHTNACQSKILEAAMIAGGKGNGKARLIAE